MLPRKQYVDELIRLKDNGRIKIITGLRRSGKSVLLFELFREHLLEEGVTSENIISVQLDDLQNIKYRNPIHFRTENVLLAESFGRKSVSVT